MMIYSRNSLVLILVLRICSMPCLQIRTIVLLIAHNSDYGCKSILGYLQNVTPIVKSGRFLHIKTTYYNTIHKKRNKEN